MKNMLALLSFLVIVGSLFSHAEAADSAAGKQIKVGLALGGALGDQAYNDMQYKGLIEAAEKFDIAVAYRVPDALGAEQNLLANFTKILTELAEQEGCDLIIINSFQAVEPLDEVAANYPQKFFVLLDGVAKPRDNVASTTYAAHEGSFVVGALAAYVSQTKKVGMIGGVDLPIIKSFLKGFEEGLAYADPAAQLTTEYVSKFPDFSGFGNPQRGYELANQLYEQGVDVIYAAAGSTGNGVIQAASEQQKYVIGVDSDQDYLAPGFVLTSMMKRLDVSIVNLCQLFMEGKLTGSTVYEYSYKNGGISITDMKFTKEKIPADVLENIRAIERKIAAGEIHVTNILAKQP